jgi:FecR protein
MAEPTDANLDAALEPGLAARRHEPRAAAVRYDGRLEQVIVALTNGYGCTFAFPPKLAQRLDAATGEQLSQVEILGAGSGPHWKRLTPICPSLARQPVCFGTKGYVAQQTGWATSPAKVAAARANGTKTERPRRSRLLDLQLEPLGSDPMDPAATPSHRDRTRREALWILLTVLGPMAACRGPDSAGTEKPAALCPGSSRAALTSTLWATVVAVSGSCTAQRSLTDQRRPLKCGDAVRIAEEVDVPADGKLKVRMANGSLISLASGSNMTVASYDVSREAKLKLNRGLIRAAVADAGAPARFTIATTVGSATLHSAHSHSADCLMEVQTHAVQVGVKSGSVDLTSAATGGSVSVPADWGTRLEAGLDPVPPRIWDREEFDAFIRRTE